MEIQDINAYVEQLLDSEEYKEQLEETRKTRKELITDFINELNKVITFDDFAEIERVGIYDWSKNLQKQATKEVSLLSAGDDFGSEKEEKEPQKPHQRASVCHPNAFRQLLATSRKSSLMKTTDFREHEVGDFLKKHQQSMLFSRNQMPDDSKLKQHLSADLEIIKSKSTPELETKLKSKAILYKTQSESLRKL